ncbi:MAG: PIG-L family deacetylase [Acidobacteria bacterium]|nr:PIG-L family deacetylase [Acidobacteriota bacterium]
MTDAAAADRYDVMAFGAHPDDLEAVLGGTAVKLVRSGMTVLFVDLCDGEPARHAVRGVRQRQAVQAAAILGVHRATLFLHDRLIRDSPEARLAVARLIRAHTPRLVFTTAGAGVHPDHAATTDIVVHGVFYARLPKWDEIPGGDVLEGTQPHEIERLFFGHCRMEPPWSGFDFAVDVSEVYEKKMAALTAYESVFSGDQATLVDRYSAEDRYVGSLVGVQYAEAFKARSPLLVESPAVFAKARFG